MQHVDAMNLAGWLMSFAAFLGIGKLLLDIWSQHLKPKEPADPPVAKSDCAANRAARNVEIAKIVADVARIEQQQFTRIEALRHEFDEKMTRLEAKVDLVPERVFKFLKDGKL